MIASGPCLNCNRADAKLGCLECKELRRPAYFCNNGCRKSCLRNHEKWCHFKSNYLEIMNYFSSAHPEKSTHELSIRPVPFMAVKSNSKDNTGREIFFNIVLSDLAPVFMVEKDANGEQYVIGDYTYVNGAYRDAKGLANEDIIVIDFCFNSEVSGVATSSDEKDLLISSTSLFLANNYRRCKKDVTIRTDAKCSLLEASYIGGPIVPKIVSKKFIDSGDQRGFIDYLCGQIFVMDDTICDPATEKTYTCPAKSDFTNSKLASNENEEILEVRKRSKRKKNKKNCKKSSIASAVDADNNDDATDFIAEILESDDPYNSFGAYKDVNSVQTLLVQSFNESYVAHSPEKMISESFLESGIIVLPLDAESRGDNGDALLFIAPKELDGLISESAGINNTYLSNEKSIKVEKSILPTLQSKVLAISEQITTTEEIKGVDAMEGDESMSKECGGCKVLSKLVFEMEKRLSDMEKELSEQRIVSNMQANQIYYLLEEKVESSKEYYQHVDEVNNEIQIKTIQRECQSKESGKMKANWVLPMTYVQMRALVIPWRDLIAETLERLPSRDANGFKWSEFLDMLLPDIKAMRKLKQVLDLNSEDVELIIKALKLGNESAHRSFFLEADAARKAVNQSLTNDAINMWPDNAEKVILTKLFNSLPSH